MEKFEKCLSMLREFKFHTAEIGENIITEGEIGQKFYIVVSGVVSINKANAKQVLISAVISFSESFAMQLNLKRMILWQISPSMRD